jgi:metallophosphoesterase superfamily enzyme
VEAFIVALSKHRHLTRLGSRRALGLRVPEIWHRVSGLVLPSFGAFTGGFAVRPGQGEHPFHRWSERCRAAGL